MVRNMLRNRVKGENRYGRENKRGNFRRWLCEPNGAKRPLSVFSQHLVDYGLAVLQGVGRLLNKGKVLMLLSLM